MYKGQSINLAGSGASSYQWYPADLVTDYLVASTTTKFDQSNTLFLIGIAANGCVDTAKINVEVLPAPFIEVANAFTPNQDGKNDKWVIKFADQLQHIDIKVFDRYGSIVYTFSGNYANDWEGDYKGSALPDADYYYHILYKQTDAMEQQVNGSVTILR
jgi:gliding motility-associated-like protein